MEPGLPATLREARDRLAPLGDGLPAAARALDRLQRDLLPRTAGGDACLVAGIVGPNNSGKSALFNSLVGRPLSPSVPSGGATKRLLGAATPELLALLKDDEDLARFPMVEWKGGGSAEEVLSEAEDPTALLFSPEPTLPPGLLLIDTPDFDSIFQVNRVASESLLAVADIVIAVVTRHSYQNKEVVEFLSDWFRHGRPWMLVYNEAPDRATAADHTAKLAADVGHAPLAAFFAPHDLAIARGEQSLDPQNQVEGRPSLRTTLSELDELGELKSKALAASLEALRDDLSEVAAALEGDSGRAHEILEVVEGRALDLGKQVALAAMPLPAFVHAFRAVLDRRTNALSRGLRTSLRRTGDLLAGLAARLTGGREKDARTAPRDLAEAERQRLDGPLWSTFWEDLLHDLGRAARHPARQDCGMDIAARLDQDLRVEDEAAARERALEALEQTPADEEYRDFEEACEEMVEREVAERGREWLLQRAADVITLTPLVLGSVLVFQTGGLGSDVLVGSGGASLSLFMEKRLARLLGSGVAQRARQRWSELRGPQLQDPLAVAALPAAAPWLRANAARNAESAGELRRILEAL